nr:TRAM domain-containing protein [Arthrobacter terrae]
MENPQTLTLTLGPVAHGGHCVARHEGRVIFVRHGIPGEVVRVTLTEHDDGASFWRGDVTEVLEASADRVPHFWAKADSLRAAAAGQHPVGGAEFGHISRSRQRQLKAEVLVEQLHRLAGIELDGGTGAAGRGNLPSGLLADGVENLDGEVSAVSDDSDGREGSGDGADGDDAGMAQDQPAGLGWRTRAGFAVTAAGGPTQPGRLGMHAHRSEVVLPVRQMPLAGAEIDALRLWEIDLTGVTRIEVSAPANGSAPLVLLATDPQLSDKARGVTLKRIARQLQVNAGANRGAESTENAARVRVSVAGWDPESGALTLISGRSRVCETAAGHEFRVSSGGFWQIHRRAPEVLTGAVMKFLTDGPGASAGHTDTGAEAGGYLFPGATVADLYAGAGLFSASLADAVGPTGSVLSVEGSAGSSKDARKNLHAASQVEIRQGRVERVLHERSGTHAAGFDVIVLDPPRAGAGKNVVRQLIASAPRAIAYVSCDPASFARDVGYFRAAGWNLSKLRAFDLYPHTHHLETVALLTPGSSSIG